jgi:ribosomal protein S18 acetylase RimI-like enzyme
MSLSPDDIDQIAALQVDLLRDSLVSRFGKRYAASYWHYVDRAEEEAAIIVRATDGTIVAACALSFAPATLAKRLVIHTPLTFYAIRNLFAPWLWAAIRALVIPERGAGPDLAADGLEDAAEIVMLMTHPHHRRSGHARALLVGVEALLAKRGLARYCVRTSDKDPGAADFYRDNGFREAGYFNAHGATFKLLTKAIALPSELKHSSSDNAVSLSQGAKHE